MTVKNVIETEYIKRTLYSENEEYQLLITCPHAYLGKAFVQKFPEIKKHIQLSEHELNRYLAIEQDFGTEELSEKIGEVCHTEFGIPALVVQPLFPRSIVDAGRLVPHNIRNIIDYDTVPELKKTFLDIHASYLEELIQCVNQLNTYKGIALDLHTMSSFSPFTPGKETYSEAIDETPGSMHEYIQSYDESHIKGSRRDVELFTGDPKNSIHAYKPFLEAVCKNLNDQGINVEFDVPYVVAPHLTGYYLLQASRTVCIDIPKDLVSTEETTDEHYDLASLTICRTKIDRLAHMIASAAKTALKGE